MRAICPVSTSCFSWKALNDDSGWHTLWSSGALNPPRGQLFVPEITICTLTCTFLSYWFARLFIEKKCCTLAQLICSFSFDDSRLQCFDDHKQSLKSLCLLKYPRIYTYKHGFGHVLVLIPYPGLMRYQWQQHQRSHDNASQQLFGKFLNF